MTKWILGVLLLGAAHVGAVDFYAHWADGKAEISSYEVIQPRYGELRQGYGVMIFVTESLHRQTFIKADPPTPEADQFYALKLNHILNFTTGIYDYSVMTSVFSQVAGERHPFELRRISFSAQEWCGQVFDEALFRNGQIEGHISSYFASEGRGAYQLKQPENFASEDHLLIRIRELQGPFMDLGEVREVEVLPSFWQLRQAHQPHATVAGRIHKAAEEQIETAAGALASMRWELRIGQRQRTLWTERAYPHRILRWEDGDGGRGELMQTIRVPYWQLQANADEVYRRELGIP